MDNQSSKYVGYIYVLTNKMFVEDCVKIGYSENPFRRVKELSASTGVPYPFEIYCVMKTTNYNDDKTIHNFIESIAPRLRIGSDESDHPHEFFKITPWKALLVLEVAQELCPEQFGTLTLFEKAQEDYIKIRGNDEFLQNLIRKHNLENEDSSEEVTEKLPSVSDNVLMPKEAITDDVIEPTENNEYESEDDIMTSDKSNFDCRITVTLPKDLRDRIIAEADEQGFTASCFMRLLAMDYLYDKHYLADKHK